MRAFGCYFSLCCIVAYAVAGKSAHSTQTWPTPNKTWPRSAHAVGIDENLTGFAGFQALHGFREIFHRDAVGYHGMQVEVVALEQRGHLVPGLVHAAAVDTLNGDAFENNVLGKIQRDGL